MKHNLVAINAALCLGDEFLPPVGTRCVFRLKQYHGISTVWLSGIVLEAAPDDVDRMKWKSRMKWKRWCIGSTSDMPMTPFTMRISLSKILVSNPAKYLRPLRREVKAGRVFRLTPGEIESVIYVPEGAPPFASWERRREDRTA